MEKKGVNKRLEKAFDELLKFLKRAFEKDEKN